MPWCSLQAYTVNHGGLFEINDETFRLFREIEIKMQRHLLEVLRSVSTSGQRQLIVDTVASDDDVQFLWALISCDIRQEEQAIILFWLTIRGLLEHCAQEEIKDQLM